MTPPTSQTDLCFEQSHMFSSAYNAKYLLPVFSCDVICFLQMIHNYMEHVERIKLQQITGGEASDTGTLGRVR